MKLIYLILLKLKKNLNKQITNIKDKTNMDYHKKKK